MLVVENMLVLRVLKCNTIIEKDFFAIVLCYALFSFFHVLFVALAKTYSFAIFGWFVGWCETKFTNSKNDL